MQRHRKMWPIRKEKSRRSKLPLKGAQMLDLDFNQMEIRSLKFTKRVQKIWVGSEEKKNLTILKIGSIDIIHSKENFFLCLLYLKNSFKEMWDTIKCTNVCIMRKPELKGRNKNRLWGNNGWKLYKLMKNNNPKSSTNSKQDKHKEIHIPNDKG